MLKDATNQIIEDIDELKKVLNDQLTVGNLADMDGNELAQIQVCCQLIEHCENLMRAQAIYMEDQAEKMDRILEILMKREA